MTTEPLYRCIALTFNAIVNCRKNNNTEWEARHDLALRHYESLLPSGADLDSLLNQSKGIDPDRIVIDTSFHHKDENGTHTKWTNHLIVITPSLAFDFEVLIMGRDHNRVKRYLGNLFDNALRKEVEQYELQDTPAVLP